jgi:hypothetical protein
MPELRCYVDDGYWVDGYAECVPIVDPEYDPKIMLSWSDDGGKSWVNYRQYSIGQQGKYRTRVKATRLGTSRRKGRTYRIEFSAARPFALIGALLDVDELNP